MSERFFGQRTPVTWERMTDGVSTVVYRATRGDEHFYLRILPEKEATFALEVRAHQLAREARCAVPEVLFYEAFDPDFGRSLMLTTEIPGRPLTAETPPDVAREAVRAAGRDLARINRIPVEGFGWIRRSMSDVPETLSAETVDLGDMVMYDYVHLILTLPAAGGVPGLEKTVLQRCIDQACYDLEGSASPSRLAHGDLDTSHIFIHDDRYSGIIDFGEIRGMPPYYDLGHHRMHDAERLPYSTLGWLLEGYTEVAPLPDEAPARIRAWSLLIAARVLWQWLPRDPNSQIAATARRSIRRDVAEL